MMMETIVIILLKKANLAFYILKELLGGNKNGRKIFSKFNKCKKRSR